MNRTNGVMNRDSAICVMELSLEKSGLLGENRVCFSGKGKTIFGSKLSSLIRRAFNESSGREPSSNPTLMVLYALSLELDHRPLR